MLVLFSRLASSRRLGSNNMLKGIDISGHQGDTDLSPLPIDFVIVKATEGLTYVNPYCDKKIQQAIKLGKLFGFYHYGRNSDPLQEAQWLLDNTVGYHGLGIPVLDWEEDQSVDWVNKFVRYYHSKTDVWPWIYGNPWRFNQGGVESNCGRWIAAYPNVLHPNLDYDTGSIPNTDGLVCAWQYASDGRISGYNGNLDLDHFYGDAAAWKAYAKPGLSSDGDNTEADKVAVSILQNDEYTVTITRR